MLSAPGGFALTLSLPRDPAVHSAHPRPLLSLVHTSVEVEDDKMSPLTFVAVADDFDVSVDEPL